MLTISVLLSFCKFNVGTRSAFSLKVCFPGNYFHPIQVYKIKSHNLIIFRDFGWLLLNRLCIKPGIQARGTECGQCYISGNVVKRSGECSQIFRGMSPSIPGNVLIHSKECPQTFQGMSPNSPVPDPSLK